MGRGERVLVFGAYALSGPGRVRPGTVHGKAPDLSTSPR